MLRPFLSILLTLPAMGGLPLSGPGRGAPPTVNGGGGVVGGLAADIAGVDSKGTPCALSDYKGSVILMDIATAWCYWCQVDAPSIEALAQNFQDKGLKVVTVLAEDVNGAGPCTPANLNAWVGAYGLTFRVQSDASGTAKGIAEKVYVSQPASGGFPTTVIIDKNFVVQYLQGGFNSSEVQAKVAALLAQ